jgi:hypothetical protein
MMDITLLAKWLTENAQHLRLIEIYSPINFKPHLMLRIESSAWNQVSDSEQIKVALDVVKARHNREVSALEQPKKKRGRPRKVVQTLAEL